MFTRVLVPLDGSAAAEAALPYAERLARHAGAEVLLVRVVPPPPQSVFAPGRSAAAEEAAAAAYLAQLTGRPALRGLQVAVLAVRGYPATQIARTAARRAGTLVVMATRGLTGLRRAGPGSTADRVLHLSRAPVLLVPSASVGQRQERLVVGLDGSARAEAVLAPAADVARGLGLPLVLLHVLPPAAPERSRQAAETYLREIGDRLTAEGLPATVAVREGDPAEVLAAEDGRAVVALASHGRTGLSRLLLGSVTERVVDRAAGPVLVARVPVARRRGQTRSRSGATRSL